MFPHWILPVALGLGLVAGLLIGAIGVGGVILVPCLLQLPLEGSEEERLATAVSSCMFSYIFAGLAGTCAYLHRKSVARCSTAWLLVGVVPGAVLGAVTLTVVQPLWIKVVLYSLVALSALFSVFRSVKELRRTDQAPPASSEEAERWFTLAPSSIAGATARVVIGLLVGLGSALTGTSGPVILLPILLTLRWDTLEALGSAQVVCQDCYTIFLIKISGASIAPCSRCSLHLPHPRLPPQPASWRGTCHGLGARCARRGHSSSQPAGAQTSTRDGNCAYCSRLPASCQADLCSIDRISNIFAKSKYFNGKYTAVTYVKPRLGSKETLLPLDLELWYTLTSCVS